MSDQSVISAEYRQLQEAIIKKQNEWKGQLQEIKVNDHFTRLDKSAPFAYQMEWQAETHQLEELLMDFITILQENRPELREDLEKLSTHKKAEKWIREALALNQFYFEKTAKDLDVPAWLLSFVCEVAARPILQVIADRFANHIADMEVHGGCPCCGEPPRLAEVGKNKKKQLICPRCHTKWEEKKISCAHCGTDNHEHLKVLKVEGRETEEIHVCEECKGYTKVIQTARMLTKLDPALLDLTTLHLDYIAQEKGYTQEDVEGSLT